MLPESSRKKPGGDGKGFVMGASKVRAIFASFSESRRRRRNGVRSREAAPTDGRRGRIFSRSLNHAEFCSRLAPSVAGDDGGLNVSAAIQHVPQNLLQSRKGRLSRDVVRRTDLLRRNQTER